MLPCLVLAGSGAARAGGAGDRALRLSVTVNDRASGGERPVAVRAGGQVVKRYRLVNQGGADLHGVRVRDPGNPSGVVVRCPRRVLVGLTSMECVARFRALPGTRTATVRAEGRVPSLGLTARATDRAGYTGVLGALVLGERVRVAVAAGGAAVTYTVANRGNRALYDVRLTDPALRLSPGALDCGGRPGVVPVLPSGASVRCTATVRRPAGTHRSTGVATATDRVGTYDSAGRRVPAPLLTARAGASFTVPEEEAQDGEGSSGGVGVGGAAPGAPGSGVAAVPPPVGAMPVGPPAPDAPPATGAEAGAGAGIGVGEAGVGAPPGVVPGGVGGEGLVEAPPAGPEGVREGGAVAAAPRPDPPRPASSRPESSRPESPAADATSRAAGLDDEGFLGRLRRRGREADEMGVVVMLLLLLVPAALAAALLGNRRS
ncbi:hypothetical protein [Streptomyces sp. NRRL F-5727]|uniref:hypothetical protein n=1 Tax=Streptomyces sp. NRRL F-5727 TaxID=1463871 RepID=UPI0004CB44FD|nr:hypothetical protein [Streptomyces sp. NRRL F-5727]